MKTLQEKLDLAAKACEPILSELLNEKTDYELEEELRMQFEDYLNDSYGTIEICGQVFFASDILKECDPIAFRVYQSDFESYLENE
jgi:hypothetical protein